MVGIAGGALGATLGIFPMIWMRRWRRQRIEDLLGHGGLLLWVHISDKKCEELARMILAHHPALEVGSGVRRQYL
jgi:hypothetical protein